MHDTHTHSSGAVSSRQQETSSNAAVSGLLFAQLRNGRCRVHDADLRVRVLETGLATYPNITIVRDRLERDPEDANAVTNPSRVDS